MELWWQVPDQIWRSWAGPGTDSCANATDAYNCENTNK